jgi:hypothetical protein
MSEWPSGVGAGIVVGFVIFSITIVLWMGFIGTFLVIFATLVLINRQIDEQAQKSKEESLVKSGSMPTSITMDHRINYQVPTNCPECGVSLSNDDVQWIGPLQAKCPFCQTTIEVQPSEF